MLSDKVFLITLLVSAALHAVVLVQHSNLSPFSQKDNEKKIEVLYLKQAPEKILIPIKPALQRDVRGNLPSKVTLEDIPTHSMQKDEMENIFKKNIEQLHRESRISKPAMIKPESVAVKKKISLPPVEIEKINNPSYINYYQLVREKIRRAAYHNYIRSETGEVLLSFVIAKEGQLIEVKLQEDKSTNTEYLKRTALQSIHDATPFPAFPKELDYPQLSFNVIISFELE